MPAIRVHHTDTQEGSWDGPGNVKRLKADAGESYYRRMYAWIDADKDPETKAAYKGPHHFVDADGNIGAASVKGCQTLVAVLNGSMGGMDIPEGDRRGVYNHAKAHLLDSGIDEEDIPALRKAVTGDKEVELRSFALGEIRAEDDEDGTKIVGLAAVYNRLSDQLGWFVEIIEPGFFKNVLDDDVRALWNHNTDKPLGRSSNGTLVLKDDDLGLRVSFSPPDTQWGRDAITSVKRGDVDQMSFSFKVKTGGDEWSERDDGVLVRRLKSGGCERLFDVSPVTFPAYSQTSATVRSKLVELRSKSGEVVDDPADDPDSEPTGRAWLELQKRRLDLAQAENSNLMEI